MVFGLRPPTPTSRGVNQSFSSMTDPEKSLKSLASLAHQIMLVSSQDSTNMDRNVAKFQMFPMH